MTEIINNFASPAWWISVVFAGIFVSLGAAYLKPLLDQQAAKISTRYKNKLRIRKEQREKQVNHLATHSHAQLMEAFAINRMRIAVVIDYLFATSFMVLSIFLLPFGVPKWFIAFLFLLASFYILVGLRCSMDSYLRTDILDEALSKNSQIDVPLE